VGKEMQRMNMDHFSRKGQAAVEYILVVSLVLLALFTGVDKLLFSALNNYVQNISAVLNLPIP
jgi:uncharacterized protein (UPF0333 family)